MNSRNLNFIRPYNLKEVRCFADDKLLTKEVLLKKGVPVPGLLAVIKNEKDLENFNWDILPDSFVLKPNQGLGGEGIMVIFGRKKKTGNWVKADREEVTKSDIKAHILNILEGNYSLAGVVDVAFFEERIKILKLLKPYSFRGIPDVRVIVFNKVPVMAMLRLPTKQSQGKANLHLGGICIGIDLNTGVTTTAIAKNLTTQRECLIDYVPETRLVLSGIKIPFWKEILEMSVKSQEATKLGFVGADIMIDRERGPLITELNARPGLAIQIANLAPLKVRLEKVKGLKIKSIKRGVRIGQDLFGGEIEEDIEAITGKKILGIFETVIIKNTTNSLMVEEKAKIDTGAETTSISSILARKLGFNEVVDFFKNVQENKGMIQKVSEAEQIARVMKEKYVGKIKGLSDIGYFVSANGLSVRPKIRVELFLGGINFFTEVNIAERTGLQFKVIIGRKDLKKFIVDPSKGKEILKI